MTRADFIGSEFDWYGVDQDGHVAVFFSGGWGPVPDRVFDQFEGQQLIEFKIGLSALSFPDKEFLATKKHLSDRGIFGYDWLETFGPYGRFVGPDQVVKVSDLKWDKELEAALIPIPNVRFADFKQLLAVQIPSFTDVDRRCS